ncbi:vitellogenin receptor [Euwallacea fornicatus]|uniref:vitellogenin receptor n=1 Tax=Euwallacea fornicatus TaxID=995702 RepID=UPI00339066DB
MFSITALLLAGAVMSSQAFLESLLRKIQYSNCPSSEFQCANTKCVSVHSRCDGKNDCEDFSDEQDCDFILCKDSHFFKCDNKRCIAKSLVCNKVNDCGDYTDEQSCNYFKAELDSVNTTCASGEWQCTDSLCIPEDWVCNQEMDCLDGSDEGVGCSIKEHNCDGFRCINQRCIPQEWRCDGHDDCMDNSDELDCEHHFDPKQCTTDQRKYICLDGKACVDFKMVCNGKYDCFDKSDEGKLCNHSELNCSTHGCSHDCYQLPTGPKCFCPVGYHNVDEKTCVDINECEEFGICDQKCKNIPGSYECYCEHKYILQDDKRTCKAVGGEATMIFTSKTEIRLYLLNTNLLFPVATNLKQVVGISSDGHYIYWSDVYSQHETIVRALEDGSNKEAIVTSGLSQPEDLEVDWLTKNIYFTDAQMQHIGVCSNDGSHCTVLVNKDIRKPRAIALNVVDGIMYWTDWAEPAEIASAYMDGSNAKPFLRENVHWPNGLTLDYPNSRLYWTDAKKLTLESIHLDGTSRRVILQGTVKHPFAIAVFEDKLYWSDWGTHSIDSCNKFTGKGHHTIIKESNEFIYGISIYHSALQQRVENPCAVAFCSDICLLKGDSYACACSEGRLLGNDAHTCQAVDKKQMLVVAAKNILMSVEHKSLGKHSIGALPSIVRDAGAVTYNTRNHSVYLADLTNGNIVELSLHSLNSVTLPIKGLEKVTSMDYDPTGNNLYICDSAKATLEVVSLNTFAQKVLIHDAANELPQSVAVVPQEGIMFVSFRDKTEDRSHIDRMSMDGTGRTHVAERSILGPIILHFDAHYHRLYMGDSSTGTIEHMSTDGDERHLFKNVRSTISDVTTLNSDLFWANHFSKKLYWADKSTGKNTQKMILDMAIDIERMHLTSVTPGLHVTSACQINNGNCSHICLSSHKSIVCACPIRMVLDKDNKRCIHRLECDSHEFMCSLSNMCVLATQRCNGKYDCQMGEDEEDCRKEVPCPIGYFPCNNGECIPEKQICDHHYDCKDKSDEQNCSDKAGALRQCAPNRFRCADGECVDERFVCDGVPDCHDSSDEHNCVSNTCTAEQFRCESGECISKSWECDHEYDCKDFSDEHSECGSVTCSSHMFTCGNGKCMDKSLLCDGSDDCGDQSDELNCFSHIQETCQFACASNQTVCLDPIVRCNGSVECPGGDDEKNCNSCGADSFECSNKKCISSFWTCDGTDDCGDQSDENSILCQNTTPAPSKFLHIPCDQGYRCKSGACISFDLVCNEKHDCFDESDEGGLCATSCDFVNNPCGQNCIRTPSGPTCTCKEGFRLMGDGRTCKDINECNLEPPVCSQLCENTEGGFQCDCYKEFSLRGDKRSCKALGEPLTLLYTIYNQIRQITQKTNSLRIVYAGNIPKIAALEVAIKDNAVLFAIENSPTIYMMNLDTLKMGYIEHIGYPTQIAYDWATGNIYYHNAFSADRSISVCSFRDMACAKLIDVDTNHHVSELVIDSINRVMFYSLTTWFVINSPSFVLYRAALDGTAITEIIPATGGFISGLTYDMNKRQLFYADQQEGQIVRTTYDGHQKSVIFGNLTHPKDLKFHENTLYFTTNNGEISKCLLYGTRPCEKVRLSAYNFDLFTLAQEGLQPKMEDPCANNSCAYMCVMGSSRFKCLCEDGSIVDEREKCSDSVISKNSPSVKFHHSSLTTPEDDSGDSTKTVVTVILISLLIALVGLGLIYYARRKKGAQAHLSMRFYNPRYNKNAADGLEKPILVPGQHEYVNPLPESNQKSNEFVTENRNDTHLIDV